MPSLLHIFLYVLKGTAENKNRISCLYCAESDIVLMERL